MIEEVTAVDGAEAATPAPVVEQASTQEPATAQGEPTEPAATPARDEKGRFVPQERLNEVTRARRQAERERDHLRQELEALRSQVPQRQHQAPTEQAPTLEQFGYDAAGQAAYSAALADWVEQRSERKRTAAETQASRQKVVESFEQRASAFAQTHPDFNDRLDELSQTVRLAPEVLDVIGLSDHGPEVVYHLAQRLDVADRISRLPVHLAVAEIARLEQKVTAPKPQQTTNAPAPVPVLGGSSSAATKDPAKMSYAEYKKYRLGG
jgi:hypothetical protein